MKNFTHKIFSFFRKNTITETKDKTGQNVHFKQRILQAVSDCETGKSTALNEIEQIKNWANEAISKIFEVPRKYWYDEINCYESIKVKPVNSDIGKDVLLKADEVVEGYRNQVKLRESKIQLCDALLVKYSDILDKYEKMNEKLSHCNEREKQLIELSLHNYRLKEMNDDTSEIKTALNSSNKFSSIMDDVKAIEEQYNFSMEYQKQLKDITIMYSDENNTDDFVSYKDEIDKLRNDLA